MSDPKVPTGPGWWWVSVDAGVPECVRVLVRLYRGEPDGFCVGDGDGLDIEDPCFYWIAPILTPAEAAALTARAERAERERDELRAESAAYRAERDQMRRWAEEAAADENANAAELREVRATLAAVAALVGPGDVVERVRALLPMERVKPITTYRLRIGRNAPISEWIACCSRLADGAAYAVALLECVGEGLMPEQLTEDADAVADLREHMGDLVTITEEPYTDECAF